MIADVVALGAFLVMKSQQDSLIVAISTATIVVILTFETIYLRARDQTSTG